MNLTVIFSYISQDVALTIYKTMILPILEYGDILCDNVNKKPLNKLQAIQNRCLHTCILPNQHVPTIRINEICKIANLKMRREMHLQFFMYKQKRTLNCK